MVGAAGQGAAVCNFALLVIVPALAATVWTGGHRVLDLGLTVTGTLWAPMG
jgi:hypothetical protein